MTHLPRLLRTGFAALLVAAPLAAQGVNAQLPGQILSNDGKPIEGAQIQIIQSETGYVRTVRSDAQGRFIAPALPVGPYKVTVTKDGYNTASNIKLTLSLGDSSPLNVRLTPVSVATVEVISTVGVVDTERTTIATNMSPETLTNLPVKGRGFTDFAFLTPQVTLSDRGNIAIGGQRGVNTAINLDGGDFNESFFGGTIGGAEGKTPFTVSIEAVREFQVITDGASAEFGRMGGGYLNAITKGGTNELTGSLFFYARPQSLVAKDHQTGLEVSDFKTQQFGFSLGGPIVKDKLFYFVAYDAQRETRPVQFMWGGTNPPTGLLPLDPSKPSDAMLLSRAGDYKTKADSDTMFLRLDWVVNLNHVLQFRINTSKFKGDAYTGMTNAYENSISDDVNTQSLMAQWNWNISSSLLNEAMVNYTFNDMPRGVRGSIPQIQIGNVGYYGMNPYRRTYENKRTQIKDTLSYVTPNLTLKAGFDLNINKVTENFFPFGEGFYYFSNITDYRAGNWNYFRQRFGMNGLSKDQAGDFADTEKQYAAFIQADYRLTNSFKVGFGLRWDKQEHPSFDVANFNDRIPVSGSTTGAYTVRLTGKIPQDSQVSPRLSLSWTPEGDAGKTVVRFNAGRYVSTTPSVFNYQAYTSNGYRAAQVQFSSSQAATFGIPRGSAYNFSNPFILNGLPSGATLPALDVFTYDTSFKNPTTDRINLSAERAFFGDWVFGLSGAYAKTKNLERVYDMNQGVTTPNAQGRLVFPSSRPNPAYGMMALYVSDAEGDYKAATLSAKYNKEGSPFQMQLFYTYAQEKDNDSNERNFSSYSTQNTQRLQDEYGYSNNDRRHVVTGYLAYHERSWTGIQVGFNIRYLSGLPYSVTSTSDLNNDKISGNDRLLGSERNGYRTGGYYNIDLKLSRDWTFAKRVKFSVSAEVFNLFNHVERYDRVRWNSGNDAAPVLGNVSTALTSPRQAQLGVRVAF